MSSSEKAAEKGEKTGTHKDAANHSNLHALPPQPHTTAATKT